MQALKQFSLPLKGLKIGLHEFQYEVDADFFGAFEKSPYSAGRIEVSTQLEKKSDHLIFDFDYQGTIDLECDRCNDQVAFPVEGSQKVLVKYDENEREEEEVIYIHPEASEFNCAKLIYDSIILSMPMYKTCDQVERKECNPEVIKILDQNTEPESKEGGSILSEALKKIKLN